MSSQTRTIVIAILATAHQEAGELPKHGVLFWLLLVASAVCIAATCRRGEVLFQLIKSRYQALDPVRGEDQRRTTLPR